MRTSDDLTRISFLKPAVRKEGRVSGTGISRALWAARGLLMILGSLLLVVLNAWAAAALFIDLHPGAALAYLAAILVPVFLLRRGLHRALAAACGFVAVLTWWLLQTPSNERQWQPNVGRTAWADVLGDELVIHNFRDFEYRSATDCVPRWQSRTVRLSELRGMDVAINYWGSDLIAHPIVSFDFGEQGHVAFSIETRQEIGETYSALKGFFRQYELVYTVGDERDLIGVRTNYRTGEDIYLYRLNLGPKEARQRFLEYVARMNELHLRPAWYNALSANCTTSIRTQRDAQTRQPFDFRMIANGQMDEMLYDRGVLDRALPFVELKKRARINERAQAAGLGPDFSRRIREQPRPDETSARPNHPPT